MEPVLSEVGVFRHDELEAVYEYLGVVQQRGEESLGCSQVDINASHSFGMACDRLIGSLRGKYTCVG